MEARSPEEPLITLELWQRLRAFDPRCFITVERRRPGHISPFKGYPRVWMGRISPQDERAYDYETVEHPYFVELVRLLVEKGEEMKWHLPKPPPSQR
jgi:hypothetical protein